MMEYNGSGASGLSAMYFFHGHHVVINQALAMDISR